MGEEGGSLAVQPRRGLDTASTRHDVEELPACDVHDLGGELLAVVLALAHDEHLFQAQRAHLGELLRVLIHQCGAVGEHGVIDGVPVTTEFAGDLLDATSVLAHLACSPPTRTVTQYGASREFCSLPLPTRQSESG